MIYLQNNCYNLQVAKVFGVCTSVFLSYLDKTYEYQKRNKALNANDTMSISRAEIYAETGLDDEKQKEVELALVECGVLIVKPLQNVPNKNYYIINSNSLNSILNAEDPAQVIGQEKATQFTKQKRIEPTSKRQSRIADLKKKINYEDPVIQTYLVDWIDAVYSNPKGFLSPKGIEIAQQELKAYCKDSQEKAINILKIAIKGGLRDLSWAIEQYEAKQPEQSKNFTNYNDIKATDINDKEVF